MATGVLQRVSGGLGRASARAHTAGQLVLWSRLDTYQRCRFGTHVCRVHSSLPVHLFRCTFRSRWRCASGELAPESASQPSVAFSPNCDICTHSPLKSGMCDITAVCICFWRGKNTSLCQLLSSSISNAQGQFGTAKSPNVLKKIAFVFNGRAPAAADCVLLCCYLL